VGGGISRGRSFLMHLSPRQPGLASAIRRIIGRIKLSFIGNVRTVIVVIGNESVQYRQC